MRKTTFILIVLLHLLNTISHAQNFSEKELIGTWKVLKVQLLLTDGLSEEESIRLKMLENALLKSTFTFKSDHRFSFDIEIKEMKIENDHWKMVPETRIVSVQEWKEKNKEKPVDMDIEITVDGENVKFIVADAMFLLDVKKNSIAEE
ncbi:MAG: hypothetical protein WC716_09275 [Chitinophagaceae bacterium]|jgi:hypothetical protein